MAIEAGGKNGIFPVDDKTEVFLQGRVTRPWTAVEPDPDARYERVIHLELDKLVPVTAYPHLPENIHPVRESRDIVIDQDIYEEAMRLGYIETFLRAGAAVSTPTCGPCLGGYMGILAAGERCVSTTNRNFRGRMGHVDSEVYLASPYTAAASAVTGHIASAEEVLGK